MSSLSFSQLRPRSPTPSHSARTIIEGVATDNYIRNLEDENDRLKTATRVLEAGLSTALRSSSPVSLSPRRITDSPSVLAASAAAAAALAAESAALNSSIHSLRSPLSHSSSPLASYYQRKACAEADATVYNLQSQLTAAETESIRRRAETLSAEKKADDIREAYDIKTSELNRTKDLLVASNKQVLELERLLAARPTVSEREALETEISRLRLLLDSSRQSEARLREENRDMSVEISALKQSLQDSRAAQSSSAFVAAEVPRLQSDLKIKEDQLTVSRIQVNDANNTVARLSREVEALRDELRTASAALTVTVAREAEMNTVENLYQDKRAEVAALQTELVETKGKLLLLESDFHRLHLTCHGCCHRY